MIDVRALSYAKSLQDESDREIVKQEDEQKVSEFFYHS